MDRQEFWNATLGVLPVLAIFVAVIGGIYFGLFNPTPAAAAGVFLVGVLGICRGSDQDSTTQSSLVGDRQDFRHDLFDSAWGRDAEDLHVSWGFPKRLWRSCNHQDWIRSQFFC